MAMVNGFQLLPIVYKSFILDVEKPLDLLQDSVLYTVLGAFENTRNWSNTHIWFIEFRNLKIVILLANHSN